MLSAVKLAKIESYLTKDPYQDVYEIADKLKVSAAGGANMSCLLFPDVIVKWVRKGDRSFHLNSGDDVTFISNVAPMDKVHFPTTEQHGRFIVQERVLPLQHCEKSVMSKINITEYIQTIVRLGVRYGLEDLHSENVGVRSATDLTPVILDVSGRANNAERYNKELNSCNDPSLAFARMCDGMNLPFFTFFDKPYNERKLLQDELLETIRINIDIF
jgi:hypothetical protein